jgi:hypothetical protein
VASKVQIQPLIKGRATKRTYIYYLLILLGFFVICLFLSIITYPLPFSFGDTWISELGDPTKNVPFGFVIFDIGFILASIGLIPVFLNFYYRLYSFHPIIRKILLGLWLLGDISFGSIGILHDKMQPIHDIFSGIAFGCLSIGFLVQWIVHLAYAVIRKTSQSLLAISLSIGQLALFWILLFAIPVRNNIEFRDFAPWEWIGTLSIILTIFLCSVIVPKIQIKADQ